MAVGPIGTDVAGAGGRRSAINRCNFFWKIKSVPAPFTIFGSEWLQRWSPENLPEILQGLFRLLTPAEGQLCQLNWIGRHRVLGPHSLDPAKSQDIVCRIPHYQMKDSLSQRAWNHDTYDYMGGSTIVLPDLSGATLSISFNSAPGRSLCYDIQWIYRTGLHFWNSSRFDVSYWLGPLPT